MYTTPSQAVTKHWWRLSTEPLFTRCHQTGRVTHSRQSASHQVQSPVEGEGEGGGSCQHCSQSALHTANCRENCVVVLGERERWYLHQPATTTTTAQGPAQGMECAKSDKISQHPATLPCLLSCATVQSMLDCCCQGWQVSGVDILHTVNTLLPPLYFLDHWSTIFIDHELHHQTDHAISIGKGKVLTWPHSLIFALATCLIATFNPSLLRIPAYTIPKPPFPRTGPTYITTIITCNWRQCVLSRTLYKSSNSSEAELASFLWVSMLVCLYKVGSSLSWLVSTSLYWLV